MKTAILLSCCFLSLAAHQLKYNSTSVKPGQTFTAVVELDGQQILHWNNNTMTMVPDTDWMRKVYLLETTHWNTETEFMKKKKVELEFLFPTVMDYVQQSEGVHSLSLIHGCQINDENKNGFKQYNYDQEDFFRLNLTSITWTPANDKAQKFLNEEKWDIKKDEAKAWKKRLEVDCINNLQLYVNYSMSQVRPKAEVFQQQGSSPPELVCNATGFFPRNIRMSWQKVGEKVNEEDVEVGETLPHEDGNFQKRIILRVSAEDLWAHTYTCVIQHSSLKKDLRLELEGDTFIIYVFVGVILGGTVLVVVVGGIVWWYDKKANSALSESRPTDQDLLEKDDFTDVDPSEPTVIVPEEEKIK